MPIELVKRGDEVVPLLKGTRIRVIDIGIEAEFQGKSPDEIVQAHPHLSLAQVHEALAYFYEHIREMKEKMRNDEEFIQNLKLEHARAAIAV